MAVFLTIRDGNVVSLGMTKCGVDDGKGYVISTKSNTLVYLMNI